MLREIGRNLWIDLERILAIAGTFSFWINRRHAPAAPFSRNLIGLASFAMRAQHIRVRFGARGRQIVRTTPKQILRDWEEDT
jgi:hypothetical protein